MSSPNDNENLYDEDTYVDYSLKSEKQVLENTNDKLKIFEKYTMQLSHCELLSEIEGIKTKFQNKVSKQFMEKLTIF